MKTVALLFFLLLTACATHRATFVPVQPSNEKGSAVYVYRAGAISSLMLPPDINIKDAGGVQTNIGKLQYGEYKLVYLKPGRYEIQLEAIDYYAAGKDLMIEVKSQTVNYLRLDASLKFETGVRYKSYERKFDLQEVDQTIALEEIASCVDVDSKPKKKKWSSNVGPDTETKKALGKDEEAVFSIEKTSDPFSRNR